MHRKDFNFCGVFLLIFASVLVLWVLLIGLPSKSVGGKFKLIVDTDGALDDITSLLMLLSENHAEIDLIFITTVQGTTDIVNGTRNILTALDLVGKLNKIPVYMGSPSALMERKYRIVQYYFYGRDGFGDSAQSVYRQPFSKISDKFAAAKIVNAVLKYPGEISILCLGPLTNIALAMKLYPDLLNNVKSLYVSGGSINGSGNLGKWKEFNIVQDPEAASIVFSYINTSKHKSKIFMLPWDAVLNMHIDWAWRKYVLGKVNSKQMQHLNTAITFFNGSDAEDWIEADAVITAAYLNFDNIVLNSEILGVSVLTCPEKSAGKTSVNSDQNTIVAINKISNDDYKSSLLNYLQ